MSGAITAATVFRRAQPWDQVPATLRLPSVLWSLLLATTGRHTVAQIGARFALEAVVRDAAFASLVTRGLIVERELTRAEFLAASATVSAAEPTTLAQFLAPNEPTEPLFIPLELDTPEAPMAPSPPRRLRLKALMAFLAEGTTNAEEGQMNVYRLFLRLDPQRLQANGIKTLRFEDERVIDDPVLVADIVLAVETTFGRRCPESLFD